MADSTKPSATASGVSTAPATAVPAGPAVPGPSHRHADPIGSGSAETALPAMRERNESSTSDLAPGHDGDSHDTDSVGAPSAFSVALSVGANSPRDNFLDFTLRCPSCRLVQL